MPRVPIATQMFTFDIFIKLIIVGILFILLNKVFIPYLIERRQNKHRKHNAASSLDLMIKEKVGELGGIQREAQRTKRPTTKKEELILKLKERSDEEEDISVILQILENLDWGEGKELTNITELIQGTFIFQLKLVK